MKTLLLLCVNVVSNLPASAFCEVIDDKARIIEAANSERKGAWLDTEALRKCLLVDTNKDTDKKSIVLLKDERDSLKRTVDILKESKEQAMSDARLWSANAADYKMLVDKYEDRIGSGTIALAASSIGLVVGVLTTVYILKNQ